MKKVLKIGAILLIAVMLIAVASPVFATGALKPNDIKADYSVGTDDVKSVAGKILGIMQTVGVAVAVIIMIVLGIKYMMGSAEDKAEYKKSMIPYIVGAILIFASTTIVNIIYNFATKI